MANKKINFSDVEHHEIARYIDLLRKAQYYEYKINTIKPLAIQYPDFRVSVFNAAIELSAYVDAIRKDVPEKIIDKLRFGSSLNYLDSLAANTIKEFGNK